VYGSVLGLELDGGDGGSVFTDEVLSATAAAGSRGTARALVLGGGVPAATEVGSGRGLGGGSARDRDCCRYWGPVGESCCPDPPIIV